MVMKGQFLERPAIVPSGDGSLEGLAHRGTRFPPLLICPPAMDDGGSMDFPVVAELAFAAARAGHATLRFNSRGVGASQGVRSGFVEGVEDARAAFDLLIANAGSPTGAVCGYGRAAAIVLQLAETLLREGDSQPQLAILVAPSEIDLDQSKRLSVPVLFVVGEHDPSLDRIATAEHCQLTGDRLVVVPGADHVFSRGLPDLGRAVVEFLDNTPSL
jgi:uncharacterized protein